ncbi:MAG TPA: SDR family NAD(P)-dependent oxidoreductase [Actinomycetota bacterium]|nr:SDR family NAD(P)-dependent oxidoreductase [Actinomycetota bacterium]
MHVFVTGGTGALGEAVTKSLLKEGHSVTATWIVAEEAAALQREAGPGADLLTVEADVLDPDSVAAAVEPARDTFGDVDAAVHLVGAWSGGKAVHDHDLGSWRRMLDVNLTSAFVVCRAVLPRMLAAGRGRIVLVSSRTARTDRQGQAGYAVAKAGLAVLAETIAEETRGTAVTANVIAPSTIDTRANRASMPDADHSSWVTAEDVAAAIGYLASEEATALRGAWLPVYGGV